MTEKILQMFFNIAKPFEDKIGGEKIVVIQEWLNERNIENEYTPGIGLVINKQENPRTILVSHMDLIYKFRKGFANNLTFETILVKNEELLLKLPKNNVSNKIVRGALDNTITNACALLVIEELLKNEISDVEVLLSEGEEVGLIGMSGYLRAFPEKSEKAFFVNLDVTNDGWGKAISVEYDKPDYNTVKRIESILEGLNAHLQGTRYCDDTDSINNAGCAGLSYCIPTGNTIHSYKNFCSYDSVDPYYKGLYLMLKNLSKEESYKRFDNDYFKKALKSETEEIFEKKIKKAKKKEEAKAAERRSLWDSPIRDYPSETGLEFERAYKSNRLQSYNANELKEEKYPNLTAFQISERQKFVQDMTDYFVFQQKIEEPSAVYKFLNEMIMKDKDFSVKEMSEAFNTEYEDIQDMCEILINTGGILEQGDTEYKFPAAEYMDF